METNLRRRKHTGEKAENARSFTELQQNFEVSFWDFSNTFWLTRIVFLRCLAAIYIVAFAVALNQVKIALNCINSLIEN
jgi:hypothetical protein